MISQKEIEAIGARLRKAEKDLVMSQYTIRKYKDILAEILMDEGGERLAFDLGDGGQIVYTERIINRFEMSQFMDEQPELYKAYSKPFIKSELRVT